MKRTGSTALPKLLGIAACTLCPEAAFAAGLNGAELGVAWVLPFVGILLSIALFPLLAPHVWEHHHGKVAALWGLLAALPLFVFTGWETAFSALAHTLLADYIPFILLLFALFTVAGGIVVRGNLHGSPGMNTALLGIGAALASLIGTTGAAMVMIRPVLRANDERHYNAHVVVFFIFLVANIGGSLTPLGDPPLFLGFLRGVSFFWTTAHLILPTLLTAGLVLAVFFVLDTYFYHKEKPVRPDPTPDNPVRVVGGINYTLIACIIGAILFSASVDLGSLTLFGIRAATASLIRDTAFIVIALASIALTPREWRRENGFNWHPIFEVAKLFAGIFVTIIPVIAILQAGPSGILAPLVALVSGADGAPVNLAYFWLTGGLSSFLDNAPTYVVFFELAGGDAQHLMNAGATTLAAISAGAVFMGASTYLGNAPNFMVYALARHDGVRMPGFFGYMAWAMAVLIPVFIIVSLVFFR